MTLHEFCNECYNLDDPPLPDLPLVDELAMRLCGERPGDLSPTERALADTLVGRGILEVCPESQQYILTVAWVSGTWVDETWEDRP